MHIERFIAARKQKGLSQYELAEGICTQATLSRFENNAHVPNLKILNKLCNKLDLPLGELFPKVGVAYTEVTTKMNQAEFYLITSEYQKASDLLETIEIDQYEEPGLCARYLYIKGFLAIFRNEPLIDNLFIFDQLLTEKDCADAGIFQLLAYTGIGMIYAREKDQVKAEFYFSKVLEQIYAYPTKKMEDTWRVLHIVFECGVFYADVGELEISNALLNYAISICSDNHVTYYLARAAIQLAKNAIVLNRPKAEILGLIYDARAYSKVNRNQVGLAVLADMEKSLEHT
ncbi:helix-turn-helix domain-containing protein [Marinilactibacillus kalidii]|uniref:helix-turn-helix domain-containing protein n=1 Tax=Marinilactibacillus kalidii TaxID=2820274 RepID=UPI001ABE68A8|nr:helix-turn-helix transcriptional regulator [Marinilactibacillus kalidii]